ncbi:hypothetical protein MRX96_036746 [Rhipicephalus microplus]
MERAAGKMPSQPRSCKECCMQFTGPVPYLDHMQSAKHKKKMATLNQTDAPAAPLDTRVVGPVKSTSILRHPLPFSCKLCNVSMNCEAALTAHNKGKRHQRALKSQGTIQESTDVSSAKPLDGSASSVSGSNQAPAEDLSCEYCGIVLFKSMEGRKQDYSKSEVTGGPNGRYDEYGGAYDQYSEYPAGASQYDGYGGL